MSKRFKYGEYFEDGQRYVNRVPIHLPPQPDPHKIDGYRKDRSNQKWVRTDIPEGFDEFEKHDKDKFYNQEFDRIKNGYWFYNDGEPTYITGAHYYYLNWCKIDVGYPHYYDRDRRFYYFWDACEKHPDSYGMIFMKHRREGASWKSASLQLYLTTFEMNAHGGMLSKTGGDAQKLFQKVVYMWRKLPSFLMPMSDGTDNPKSAINFQRPSKRRGKNHKVVDNGIALDSSITWMTTTENAYDGQKLRFFNSDESAKWSDASSEKNWYVVKPALSIGRKIYGKALFTSTVNEMENGGEAFKNLWEDSDPEDLDANGQTRSGMWCYFNPAYDGYEGFIDEYGRSIIEDPDTPVMGIDGVEIKIGSKRYLENQRKSAEKRGANALAEEKRQRPFNEEEALRVPAKDCVFEAERIYQQLEYLDTAEDEHVIRGNFVWIDGKGSAVMFRPSANGRWLVTYTPEKDKQNCVFKGKPANIDEFVAGCDPYDHRVTIDSRRSDAAAYVFRRAQPNDPESNMFVCEYLFRQPSPELFYEDILRMCIFYGCQVLVESQKIGLINWFEREGYERYLMDRPEATKTAYSKNQKGKGIPSSTAVIDSITSSTEHYIYTNCGFQEETGSIGNVYFRNLLEDWLKFEPNKTQDYDCTMAAGYTLLAVKKRVRQKREVKPQQFVRKFDNSHLISRPIGR